MLKRSALLLALTALLVGGPAMAVVGAIDDVPAASLLVPYFEVGEGGAVTTFFSINNASAAPAIAHVTLWTDLSVPTLDFNVFLTGYDVVTFNLSDLFLNGTLPQTESVTDVDAISPVGQFSLPNGALNTALCQDQLPLPVLPNVLLTHIQNAHSGQASGVFLGSCSALDHGDGWYRGYITIDNVSDCDLGFPEDAGYFSTGGNGIANNINQLWGDYFLADARAGGVGGLAVGESLVHLEADAALDSLTTAGVYTFYARYTCPGGVPGGICDDNREALSSTWASRYQSAGAPFDGTDLLVWRDAKVNSNPFACTAITLGTHPWYPLGLEQIVIFDEDENPDVPEVTPFSPVLPGIALNPFPAETQRVGVDFAAFDFGWLYLNLNAIVTGAFNGTDPTMQNYVATVHAALGQFSVGFAGVALDNVTNPADRTNGCLGDPNVAPYNPTGVADPCP